jgi:hypothetical protein
MPENSSEKKKRYENIEDIAELLRSENVCGYNARELQSIVDRWGLIPDIDPGSDEEDVRQLYEVGEVRRIAGLISGHVATGSAEEVRKTLSIAHFSRMSGANAIRRALAKVDADVMAYGESPEENPVMHNISDVRAGLKQAMLEGTARLEDLAEIMNFLSRVEQGTLTTEGIKATIRERGVNPIEGTTDRYNVKDVHAAVYDKVLDGLLDY